MRGKTEVEATVQAAERSVSLADLQYRKGAVDFQRVIEPNETL